MAAAVTAPGGAWSTNAVTGLTCADCHDPHGTANYRNLVLRPGGIATDVTVTNGAGGVVQTGLTPTLDQYKVGNLSYRASADGNPPMSNWCSGCHSAFNLATAEQGAAAWGGGTGDLGGDEAGDSGGVNAWHRHPTSHVTMTEGNTNSHASWAWYNTGVSSRTPVASNTGAVPNGNNVPFCGTCHKAHGSDIDNATAGGQSSDNLIYDDGSTVAIQDGTSMQQTCNICHKKS